MKWKPTFRILLVLPIFLYANLMMKAQDPCTANDDCPQATIIWNIHTDEGFFCVDGCNMYASPDTLINACQMGDFPTVWYRLDLDPNAKVLNVSVSSTDFESPVISIFRGGAICNNLVQVQLSAESLPCFIGSEGYAYAGGIPILDSAFYYVAVSSLYSIGGDFELCVNTLSTGFDCVADRAIAVTGRSNGGPLEGPFDPGETVSICMNVNSYTASNNGCQWFQGLVPVFGNGWDPGSFDAMGQPLRAMVNGDTIGEPGNGLYGSATWDWFNDVDYHHNHPNYNIDDFDGNGRIEMCNSLYEADCPVKGITGGCCNPCWGSPLGDILPAGWFAYGINGSCPDPGPPVRVDWGDGNTCGAGMGPWNFCFDVITRDVPDCNFDSTRRDLSIGFFTFADGETGAWTGSGSVCGLDSPAKITLQAKCGRVSMRPMDHLDPMCSGDTLIYVAAEEGIHTWEWNLSPFWAAPSVINSGENGVKLEVPLINTTDETVDMTGILIGRQFGSEDILLKQFTFKLKNEETCSIVSVDPVDGSSIGKIKLHPNPTNQNVMMEWTFDLQQAASIDIYNSQGVHQQSISVPADDLKQTFIDSEAWSPGIYIVTLSNADFRYVTRMVKY